MKKIVAVLLLFIYLFSDSKLSPIALPKTYFINLNIYPCYEDCLREQLKKGNIFSFLANYSPNIKDKNLSNEAKKYFAIFNMPLFIKKKITITIVADKKIFSPLMKKISQSLASAFILQHQPFNIKTAELNESNLSNSNLTIALLTYKQREKLKNLATLNGITFIPTLNKNLIDSNDSSLFFGGIDYFAQLQELLNETSKLAIFYIPNSYLSNNLTNQAKNLVNESISYEIKSKKSNLKYVLKGNKELNATAILLNTPPVISSLILSQMTYYDIEPPKKLSTQINYSPKIVELTQRKDRENFYVANSISNIPYSFDAIGAIFDINLNFNWVIYATFIGTHKLLHIENGFKEEFIDNQIQYDIGIEKIEDSAFIPLKSQENSQEF
jgi:hypothetical protein